MWDTWDIGLSTWGWINIKRSPKHDDVVWHKCRTSASTSGMNANGALAKFGSQWGTYALSTNVTGSIAGLSANIGSQKQVFTSGNSDQCSISGQRWRTCRQLDGRIIPSFPQSVRSPLSQLWMALIARLESLFTWNWEGHPLVREQYQSAPAILARNVLGMTKMVR